MHAGRTRCGDRHCITSRRRVFMEPCQSGHVLHASEPTDEGPLLHRYAPSLRNIILYRNMFFLRASIVHPAKSPTHSGRDSFTILRISTGPEQYAEILHLVLIPQNSVLRKGGFRAPHGFTARPQCHCFGHHLSKAVLLFGVSPAPIDFAK